MHTIYYMFVRNIALHYFYSLIIINDTSKDEEICK